MGLAAFLPVLERLRRQGAPHANDVLLTVEDFITRGQAIAAAVAAVEAQVATTIAIPYSAVLALADDLGTFVAAFLLDVTFPRDLFDACRAAQDALFALQARRPQFAGQQTGTAGTDPPRRTGTGGLVPWTLRQGDALERLAATYLGDVDRGWEIAQLNGLDYPFLETDRGLTGAPPVPDRTGVGPNVRVTGETIFLPSDAHVPASAVVLADEDVELYGRDWQFTDDGHLAINGDGELLTIEGVPNVVQALAARIDIGRGELVLHPDYGIERRLAVGVEATLDTVRLSGLGVAKTVAEDPRVTTVSDLFLVFSGTTNRARMRVGLIGPGSPTVSLNPVVPDSVTHP